MIIVLTNREFNESKNPKEADKVVQIQQQIDLETKQDESRIQTLGGAFYKIEIKQNKV